jgi:hypothetical protein
MDLVIQKSQSVKSKINGINFSYIQKLLTLVYYHYQKKTRSIQLYY